jgi:hypothetical protein
MLTNLLSLQAHKEKEKQTLTPRNFIMTFYDVLMSSSGPNVDVESESLLTKMKANYADDERLYFCHLTKTWLILCIVNWAIFCTSIVIFIRSFAAVNVDTCVRQFSPYCEQIISIMLDGFSNGNIAPALEAVDYYDYQWPNDFHQENPYRGEPTREKDAAWLELWESKFEDDPTIANKRSNMKQWEISSSKFLSWASSTNH